VSAWKRHAMRLLPERGGLIEQADGPLELLSNLAQNLEEAYLQPDPPRDFIERLWAFAAWCVAPERHATLRRAAIDCFYVPAARSGLTRRELRWRLSHPVFVEFRQVFMANLPEPLYQDLAALVQR